MTTLIRSTRTPLSILCIHSYKRATAAASAPNIPVPAPDPGCGAAFVVCVAAAALDEVVLEEAWLVTLAVLADPFEDTVEPPPEGEVVMTCVVAEPEVAVEVQDTAVGRLVTAFALQRLSA